MGLFMERSVGNGFPLMEIFLVLFSRTGALSMSKPLCPNSHRLCPLAWHLHDPSTALLELVTKAFPAGTTGDPMTVRTLALLNAHGEMYVGFLARQFEEKNCVILKPELGAPDCH